MRLGWSGACLAIAFVLVGCSAPEDAVVNDPPKPGRSISEGKVDPTLVVKWKMSDKTGEFHMDLRDSGDYSIKSKIHVRGQELNGDTPGEWTATKDELLMERKGPEGTPFTVIYKWTLAGNALTLVGKGKSATYKYVKE